MADTTSIRFCRRLRRIRLRAPDATCDHGRLPVDLGGAAAIEDVRAADHGEAVPAPVDDRLDLISRAVTAATPSQATCASCPAPRGGTCRPRRSPRRRPITSDPLVAILERLSRFAVELGEDVVCRRLAAWIATEPSCGSGCRPGRGCWRHRRSRRSPGAPASVRSGLTSTRPPRPWARPHVGGDRRPPCMPRRPRSRSG